MARKKLLRHLEQDVQEERFNNLPQIAKDEITRLRSQVKSLQYALTGDPSESDTFLVDFVHEDIPLGKGKYVSLKLSEGSITVRSVEGMAIEVTARGGQRLSVRPMGSNMVMIDPRD